MVKNKPVSTNGAEITENSVKKMSRSELMERSTDLINQLSQRLAGMRFIPREGDNVKLGYIRAMIQALQAHNAILKDEEISELAQRIEMLEKQAANDRRI